VVSKVLFEVLYGIFNKRFFKNKKTTKYKTLKTLKRDRNKNVKKRFLHLCFKMSVDRVIYIVVTFVAYKGDSLTIHLGHKFSTYDQDFSGWKGVTCAVKFRGAWWYLYWRCHASNLNGLYLRGRHRSFADGVEWYYWTGLYYSLRFTEMKIRAY